MYIHGPGRRPANRRPPPPQQPLNHPHGGGLAIYDHPSRSHMLYLHAGLVPPMQYLTGYLHVQCSLLLIYAHTIYLQHITAHKVPL